VSGDARQRLRLRTERLILGQTFDERNSVSDFLTGVMNALPALRTRLQYGIGLLAILAFVFVQTRADTPALSQIFIYAVVPLLIAMTLIARLPHLQQFVIILVITLMSLAFLATGVTLSVFDNTPRLQAEYREKVTPPERALNARYLEEREAEIKKVQSYADYRSIVLSVAKNDNSQELKKNFDNIVGFYEGYVECRRKLQCSASNQLDSDVVDFWYTYRPIIEENRLSFWGPKFGEQLQKYAESIQAPVYLSAVRINPSTKLSELVNTEPQFKLPKAPNDG
jgi:hypothetical protein